VSLHLDLDGEAVPVRVVHHPRARRITLRVDRADGAVRVTVPCGVPDDEAIAAAHQRAAWIRARRARAPRPVPFAHGTVVPVFGEPHTIVHHPQGRFGVARQGGELAVAGSPEHLPRRVRDHLMREAGDALRPRVRAYAAELGCSPGPVRVREMRSRWGSCSPDGAMRFAWRLVFAPEPVVAYLAAHEVAHLRHLNHNAVFWATVRAIKPDADDQRAWLRVNGASLFAYGAASPPTNGSGSCNCD